MSFLSRLRISAVWGGGSDPVQPGLGGSNPPRFLLSRWFGGLALALIAAITAASVSLLSWFVTQRMLWQEGSLTRDFVQSLVLVETPLQAFLAAPGALPPEVEASFQHIARIPEVLRANVYDRERRVIWSSDKALIGRRFDANDELDLALAGDVVVEKVDAHQNGGKSEHVALSAPEDLFVEIYVPVHDVATGRVVGAIEFYKNPRGLMLLLQELRRYVTLGAVAFGALLFLALFALVRRADRIMRTQERQLVEGETFAVVGEMGTVVAHGIRNPLAAIRSSAELIAETAAPGPDSPAGAARDIIEQSDRLGAWLREWLSYVCAEPARAQTVALAPLVRSCLQEFDRESRRRHIETRALVDDQLPPVQGDALTVGQVLRSVVANAMEAVADGGHVTVTAELDARTQRLQLKVQDDGAGMDPRARAGKPLYTTKPKGLGVGLALARRVLQRHGGELRFDNAPGRGTVVTIGLRTAPAWRGKR